MNIDTLFKPDRKRLGVLCAGTSGSGKPTAVISTLRQAILSPSFGEFHRFLIIDPKVQKGDYDLLTEPVTDLDSALKSMKKERVTLYWPDYPEFDQPTLEWDISRLVDEMFDLSKSKDEPTFTFILDEASVVISPTRVPPSLKRLSVQGRAKGIIPHFVSQRPLTNRWLDANMSRVMLFRMLPVDADNLTTRGGVDFVAADERIRQKPYSFIHFDLEKSTIHNMNPVDLPKRIPRPKSRFQQWREKISL